MLVFIYTVFPFIDGTVMFVDNDIMVSVSELGMTVNICFNVIIAGEFESDLVVVLSAMNGSASESSVTKHRKY